MKDQKQEGEIGKLIYQLRIQKGIKEEKLSWGLCSISEFRKIENGEKDAEKWLLDALLGRIGCAVDNFMIILNKEQYQLYDLRNQIRKAYLMGDTKECYDKLEKLKEILPEKRGGNYQFYCKMKFLVEESFYETLEVIEKILVEIIQITIPVFTIQKIPEYYLYKEEISLCCLLAFMYQKFEKKKWQRLC